MAELNPRAAFTAQVLWLLGKVTEEQAYNVRVPAGDPVQNSLGVLLSSRVYVRSISPLNPREIIGPHGEAHLTEVWRQLCVPEDEIASHVAQETRQLQRTMSQRIAVTAAHHMWYSQEQRVGTEADLRDAMSADHIVYLQPRGSDDELLMLPGTDDVECWLYCTTTHSATASTIMWAEFGCMPVYSIFSAMPF